MKKETINIVTLGCSKNTVDSEKLIKQLQLSGYGVVTDAAEDTADIAIINTCAFINDAKEESIDTILRFVEAKHAGKLKKIFVTGCLSQRFSKELKDELPEVDSYFGVYSMPEILQTLKQDVNKDYSNVHSLIGPAHYAYMKIADGCNRNCSFCAIPGIKGRYNSMTFEDIEDEALSLGESGVRELILIAQDLTYWGMDLYGQRRLTELIERLVNLQRFEWIRLHYMYPFEFPEEIIRIINDNPSVCRYIDMPVQHISAEILRSMCRSHNPEDTKLLLKKLRSAIPDVAIRTTLIVGYPNESEDDFKQLCDFVEEFRFDRLGVFAYSHEEGTRAYKLYDDNILYEVKEERVASIMAIQQKISEEKNEQKIGSTLRTIIDRCEGDYYIGRTEFDSPDIDQEVLIPTNENLSIGSFYNIKITDSTEFDLYGTSKL